MTSARAALASLDLGRWRRGATATRALRIAALAALIAAGLLSGVLDRFELQALNHEFELRGPRRPRAPIVIVSIDEDSFVELGLAWPWPRRLHGEVIRAIAAANPAAIGVDVLWSEPSVHGPQDDEALAHAIADTAKIVVLSAALNTVEDGTVIRTDLDPPLPVLRQGAYGFGPVNFSRDRDAFVRSTLLTHLHQRRQIPSFDLLLYRLAAAHGVRAASLPAGNSVLINYRGGPRTFRTIPFYRVVRGEAPTEELRGAIVLIGATSGTLHDVFPTPFAPSGSMPGVEIHANMLETLLRGASLHRVPRATLFALAFLTGLLAMETTDRMRGFTALALVASEGLGVAAGVFAVFVGAYVWIDPVILLSSLTFGCGATVVQNFLRERREKQRLSRFFSPAVVSEVVGHHEEGALASARRTITVFFSDLRGFTTISEVLTPEGVAELLREYLTTMTDAVFRNGGTIDKFVGDAVMALFNAPVAQPDHAERAVRTALEVRERMAQLSERWEQRIGMPLRAGVGIHTGEAIVGTLGSEQRLEYTAVGDTVNLASRLESLTKEFDVPVLVSEATYLAVAHRFRGRSLGGTTVKGKRAPVHVYAIDGTLEEEAEPGAPRR